MHCYAAYFQAAAYTQANVYATAAKKEAEMTNRLTKKPDYVKELLTIFHSHLSKAELLDRLSDYHENDIAEAFEELKPEERKCLYPVIGAEHIAEIMSYTDDAEKYFNELTPEKAARVVSYMDSDDAADIIDKMEPAAAQKLISLLDSESSRDIKLIMSYDDDEIGSMITTNFIEIPNTLSIREATRAVIREAGENDNIMTIYVKNSNGRFFGAIDLKDLIIARENDELDDIISRSYPYLTDHERISDCIERIKDYAEDSLPVLNDDRRLIGVITAQDVVEAVDDEMGEDYAKLAGLTSEEDLNETTKESIKKRMPWLIILLFLGMVVSSVVGLFEVIVAALPIVMCFQSLILDMAGNVGTQSLAVTIRVLTDEELTGKQKFHLVVKETRVGFLNGMLLGILAFIFIGLYIAMMKQTPTVHAFMISGCVAVSLMTAMAISSTVGTLIPLFFHKIKVDPAVASGPLITTVNDLVAVVTYYSLAWLLLIDIMHLA